MVQRFDTICFLSDLGLDDELVGSVKAVVRELAAHVTVVDLTHGVASFDVRAGSLALARCISYVPGGVVVAAVDPGAGGDRAPVAIEVAGGAGVLVGPDNGLLAPAVALTGGAERAVRLTNTDLHLPSPSPTTPVRDIYAPVAAHLCNGVPLDDLGDAVDPGLLLPSVIPLPRNESGRLVAEVLWVDRFGNLQLNVGPEDLDGAWGVNWGSRLRVSFGDSVRSVEVVRTFADIAPGAPGVVVDSSGMFAIALDRFSAATDLGLGPTDQVVLEPLTEERADSGVVTPVQLRPTR